MPRRMQDGQAHLGIAGTQGPDDAAGRSATNNCPSPTAAAVALVQVPVPPAAGPARARPGRWRPIEACPACRRRPSGQSSGIAQCPHQAGHRHGAPRAEQSSASTAATSLDIRIEQARGQLRQTSTQPILGHRVVRRGHRGLVKNLLQRGIGQTGRRVDCTAWKHRSARARSFQDLPALYSHLPIDVTRGFYPTMVLAQQVHSSGSSLRVLVLKLFATCRHPASRRPGAGWPGRPGSAPTNNASIRTGL